MLHVQEEGGQGTLRGIGVVGATLALLLAAFGLAGAAGNELEVTGKAGERGDVDGSRAAIDNVVGVLEVRLAEVCDVGLQGHHSHEDLEDIVSTMALDRSFAFSAWNSCAIAGL